MDNKKRKKLIILIIILIFLLTISGTVLWANSMKNKKEKKEIEKKVTEYPEYETVTCVKEKGNDDVRQTEIVYLEKGVLISRTNISEWVKEIPKEITCKYYKQQTEKLDLLRGISSTVSCDEMGGTAKTVYTIAEMDREETRLKQFDFLDKNDIFFTTDWIMFMEDNSYECERG